MILHADIDRHHGRQTNCPGLLKPIEHTAYFEVLECDHCQFVTTIRNTGHPRHGETNQADRDRAAF